MTGHTHTWFRCLLQLSLKIVLLWCIWKNVYWLDLTWVVVQLVLLQTFCQFETDGTLLLLKMMPWAQFNFQHKYNDIFFVALPSYDFLLGGNNSAFSIKKISFDNIWLFQTLTRQFCLVYWARTEINFVSTMN